MTYTQLIAAVADESGLSRGAVAAVFRAFMHVAFRTLMTGAEVRLRGFGAFYTVKLMKRELFGGTRKVEPRRSIRFRESRMEKYGVVIDTEKTKTGGKGENCPDCGEKLDAPSHCPKDGTKPFEKKPETSKTS